MTRKPLIKATSPAPGLLPGEVVLHRHTWYGHVQLGHNDVDLEHVRQAIIDPCEIAESKTVPGNYLLLNHNASNAAGQTTLRVPVRPDAATGTNIVTSAYYSDATSHGKVVWKRGDV